MVLSAREPINLPSLKYIMEDKVKVKNDILTAIPSIKCIDLIYNSINQKDRTVDRDVFKDAITELVQENMEREKDKKKVEEVPHYSPVHVCIDKYTQTDVEEIIVTNDECHTEVCFTAQNNVENLTEISNLQQTSEKYKSLVEQLKSEITFLREDSSNKSKIIEHLTSSIINHSTNTNDKHNARNKSEDDDIVNRHLSRNGSINVEASTNLDLALDNTAHWVTNSVNNLDLEKDITSQISDLSSRQNVASEINEFTAEKNVASEINEFASEKNVASEINEFATEKNVASEVKHVTAVNNDVANDIKELVPEKIITSDTNNLSPPENNGKNSSTESNVKTHARYIFKTVRNKKTRKNRSIYD